VFGVKAQQHMLLLLGFCPVANC